MLDLFTIFSKGGMVLWYFQGTNGDFTNSVNALIKSVILQERGGSQNFTHGALCLKYVLDNEFELVFVVGYQKILQLSYVDKFLTDIQRKFRDIYQNDLHNGKSRRNFDDFTPLFTNLLRESETTSKQVAKANRPMRSFGESQKSKKTIASMIETKGKNKEVGNKSNKGKKGKNVTVQSETAEDNNKKETIPPVSSKPEISNGEMDDETISRNRQLFFKKNKNSTKEIKKSPQSPSSPNAKKGKAARTWEHGGKSHDAKALNYGDVANGVNGEESVINAEEESLVGTMSGEIHDMETESSEDEAEEIIRETINKTEHNQPKPQETKSSRFGFLSNLKNLVGSKTLTREDIQPTLEKMKDHLIGKNVAADIAEKLCDSVATKLEGRVLGTFNTVTSTVKNTLQEACVQILSPRRRIDILRDAMEARSQKRPYTITFCGVNGVGKSTNLAKVAFWLIENNLRVLIAACDTFRAGAVEQLRTHTRKLNALHPARAHNGSKMVEIYEKGYGKDAAGIAMEAINYARDIHVDVVLIDTAGRMQDNEPLMRALAKLIKVNQPDLVLFVGEALVGNEAVDQLTKFNQALADHSNMENPRLIDGILLTKFDTIDDKVGAAISMTYTTGQPIVFVGTGQTYTDLKNLNSKAVVNSLLKA